ncbi:MAG TPA: zinc metallopeptidase [Clostridiales bacterium]|nr:zinc metallopeptidase [Clostridiales bacterium]
MWGYGYYGGGWGTSLLFLLPAILLALYAQFKVSDTFRRYLRVPSQMGYTGAQVARQLLNSHGLNHVPVEMVRGTLTDHYDPRRRILRLSPEVYNGTSVASLGVAAHETGHALQHHSGYIPLSIRNSLFPIANFGSQMAWFLVLLGLVMNALNLIDIGIILYIAAVLFQVVTLPVEFNASSRAIEMLQTGGYITREEVQPTKRVLSAAALTYVAAMAVAIAQLLRLFALRNSRR